MSKANQYYLIARDRVTNECEVVPINGCRCGSLEEIDLYTTNFSSEDELGQELFEEEVISFDVPDLFIFNQGKVKGKPFVNIQEVLYQKHSVVCPIARASMTGEMKREKILGLIDNILDSFVEKVHRTPVLFEQIVAGHTNIYEKFVNYLLRPDMHSQIVKFCDGGWARGSYPLIRNVVEASTRKDRAAYRFSDKTGRELAMDEIIKITSPDYDPNQMSMFDQMVEPSAEDKLLQVMDTFDLIPAKTFIMGEETVFFNPCTFCSYTDEDYQKFHTNLSVQLRIVLHLLTLHRDAMEEASGVEKTEYKKSIARSKREIIGLLSDPDALEKAYEWCRLYHSYKEKALGDVHGGEYQKGSKD